jgi:hypothetical protein
MMISDDKRSFTAVALETISGGFIVCATGADDQVTGSGVDSYAYTDIKVCAVESAADDETAANTVIGLAAHSATSGNEIGVIGDGIFILEGDSGGITPGMAICATGSVNYFGELPRGVTGSETLVIGRALTGTSAEEKYFIGRVHF